MIFGNKCKEQYTIDYDTLDCDLTEGHDGPHVNKFYGGNVEWKINYD